MPLVTSQGYNLGANVLGAFQGGQDRARQRNALGRQDRGRELAGTVLGSQAGRTPEMQRADVDEMFKNDPNMAAKVMDRVGARSEADVINFGKVGALINSTDEQGLPQMLEAVAAQMGQNGASEKSINSITELVSKSPQEVFRAGKVMEGLANHTASKKPAKSIVFQDLLRMAQDPNSTELERNSARRKLGDLAKQGVMTKDEKFALNESLSDKGAEILQLM